MTTTNSDGAAYKDLAGHNRMQTSQPAQQLDVFGTPMPVKSPVNFEQRLEMQKESNKAAKKKLITVSLVSTIFIAA